MECEELGILLVSWAKHLEPLVKLLVNQQSLLAALFPDKLSSLISCALCHLKARSVLSTLISRKVTGDEVWPGSYWLEHILS